MSHSTIRGVVMINTFNDIVASAETLAAAIPQISGNTNFWMVRSKQGVFYNEYVDGNYIAIGWNSLPKSLLNSGEDDDAYKKILKDSGYPDKVPGTAVNKCRRFIDEIKPGDIAMIVGRTEIAFATIGDYFEVSNERTTPQKELEVHAQIESGTYFGLNCPYSKRRQVTIISKVDLDCAPPMVYKCLVSNRHSLSSLNEYADAILSCCYDLVYYADRLILKYHVRQPRNINPVDFSLFTLSITSLLTEDRGNISGKYNLNSEGDIILFLTNCGEAVAEFLKGYSVPVMLGYFILFGGKMAGIEFPSSIEKVKEVVTDFLCRRENRRLKLAEVKKAEAEVKKIEAETEKILADTEKTKLEVEEMRAAQRKADEIVTNLSHAAGPLNIKPPSNKIIDLSAVFQTDSESE